MSEGVNPEHGDPNAVMQAYYASPATNNFLSGMGSHNDSRQTRPSSATHQTLNQIRYWKHIQTATENNVRLSHNSSSTAKKNSSINRKSISHLRNEDKLAKNTTMTSPFSSQLEVRSFNHPPSTTQHDPHDAYNYNPLNATTNNAITHNSTADPLNQSHLFNNRYGNGAAQ